MFGSFFSFDFFLYFGETVSITSIIVWLFFVGFPELSELLIENTESSVHMKMFVFAV